jgi:error-prone DNA polymerase
VYASAWLKVHRTAAFYAALLNCQPMGFYSSASLVQDARRRGVKTLPPCVLASDERCRVDADDTIRLGLGSVKGVRAAAVQSILAARRERPFASMADFLRRTVCSATERRALSGAGALNTLSTHRRAALWAVEAVNSGDDLFRHAPAADADTESPLAAMTLGERLQADYEHLELTVGAHPMRLLRAQLPRVTPAEKLGELLSGVRVQIAGAVITRQRPGTAKGVCFITLEDETGHANAIVRPGLFESARLIINLEPALLIAGRLQNERGVIHVLAEKITALPVGGMPAQASHDYH